MAVMRVVAQRGFARHTNGADRRFFVFCPGQGRRRKPIVCPTMAVMRVVAQAFLPVWLAGVENQNHTCTNACATNLVRRSPRWR